MILNNRRDKSYGVYEFLRQKASIPIHIRGHDTGIIPAKFRTGTGMRTKIKHRGKIAVFSDKLRNLRFRFIKNFSNGKGMVRLKTTISHFSEKITDSLRFRNHSCTIAHSVIPIHRKIMSAKRENFLNIQNSIDTEAGYALVQPPVNHLIDFFSEFRILPV